MNPFVTAIIANEYFLEGGNISYWNFRALSSSFLLCQKSGLLHQLVHGFTTLNLTSGVAPLNFTFIYKVSPKNNKITKTNIWLYPSDSLLISFDILNVSIRFYNRYLFEKTK